MSCLIQWPGLPWWSGSCELRERFLIVSEFVGKLHIGGNEEREKVPALKEQGLYWSKKAGPEEVAT